MTKHLETTTGAPPPRSPLWLTHVRALEIDQGVFIERLSDDAAPCAPKDLGSRISPYLTVERKKTGRRYTVRSEDGGVWVWRLT